MIVTVALSLNAQFTSNPVIGLDGSVSFSISAPGADTVRLIIDTRVDTLMQRQGDKWKLTLNNLEPDLYMYNYVVDGTKVLDVDNAHVLRDVKNVMSTFVLDPQGDCPMAVHDVPHGEVRAVWYESPTLSMKRRMMVYLPEAMSRAASAIPSSISCMARVVTRRCGWSRAAQPRFLTT